MKRLYILRRHQQVVAVFTGSEAPSVAVVAFANASGYTIAEYPLDGAGPMDEKVREVLKSVLH